MAQPTPYTREFNFSDQQAATPATPIPAPHLDAELNRVKLTTDQILANLTLIQADDGTINGAGVADGTIGYDQLDPDILADFVAAGVDPGAFAIALETSLPSSDAFNDALDLKADITAVADDIEGVDPNTGRLVFHVEKYGGVLDGTTNDTAALVAAMTVCNARISGGGYPTAGGIVTTGGKPIKTSGDVTVLPGCILDFDGATWSVTNTTDQVYLSSNSQLQNLTLSALGIASFVGPLLNIDDTAGYVRTTSKFCGGGLGLRLEGPGNGASAAGTGLKIIGNGGAGITEIMFPDLAYYNFDYGIHVRGETSWANSGWIRSRGYGCKRFITIDRNTGVGSNEVSAWTMEYQIQPNTGTAIAVHGVYVNGRYHRLLGQTWDWSASGSVKGMWFGPNAYDNHHDDTLLDLIYVVEDASDGSNSSYIRSGSGLYRPTAKDPMVPGTTENSSYTAADNVLNFADQQYTVTNTGTNSFTNLANAFRQTGSSATIASLTDSTVKIDLGSTKNYLMGVGVLFGFAQIAPGVKIEYSTDDVSYTTIINATGNLNAEVVRIGKSFLGNARYLKYTFTGSATAINVQSIFAYFGSEQGNVWLSRDNSNYAAPAIQFNKLAADRTLADVNTVQTWFDTGSDEITLLAATTYEIEAEFNITRAAGTTSHTFALSLGGTATLNNVAIVAIVANPNLNGLAAPLMTEIGSASAWTVTAANTSATEQIVGKLRGTIRVTGAGTLIPQLTYSAAPGGAPTIKKDSTFRLWPVGTSSVAAVGKWS